MKHASETGVYSLRKCLSEDLIFSKDAAPAIPYKEEYFRRFFDLLDDILLSEKTVKRIIGFQVHYPVGDKFILDYGHWELLLTLCFLSLTAEKIQDGKTKEDMQKYFFCNARHRFDWLSINDFMQKWVCSFKINEFLKLPDDELSEIEKHLRPVAESAWEYTNCIDLGSDEKCLQIIKILLENAYFMVVAAPDDESSLQTAASMYGSFMQLTDTRIENLEEGWKIYE